MRTERRTAFSLAELLVVLGIVGLLGSISLPAIQNVRAAAARMQCQNHVRQVVLALHHYHADRGHLPPGRHALPSPANPRPRDPDWLLSWRVLLLPYLEETAEWGRAVQACQVEDRPWLSPPHTGLARIIKVFTCPLDSRLGTPHNNEEGLRMAYSSYFGVLGSSSDRRDGLFARSAGGPGRRLTDAHDGTSNTLLIGERPPPDTWRSGQWYCGVLYFKPNGLYEPENVMSAIEYPYGTTPCGTGFYGPGREDNPCDAWHFWSLHRGGAMFGFADGSTRWVPYSARPILPALASAAGGEIVDAMDF